MGQAEPWERIKRRERMGQVLSGLVPTLPPLLMAYRLQERAASVGFDWPDVEGPLSKVREELSEVEDQLQHLDSDTPGQAPAPELVDEIGDLFFAAVNLARKAGVQPGAALDRANRKFRQRFEGIERLAIARGIDVATAGLEVLDDLWQQVKADKALPTDTDDEFASERQ
jgi:uncharacterized protein YabN with tetrapyrrole methylase and pyrophosphatase domain